MALTTFTELKSAILDWAERSDLASKAADFVTLSDARIRKALAKSGLRVREMETEDDLTPTSGVCTLPADFMAVKRVQARTSSPRRLEYKSPDWLDEAYPDSASGDPAFYTIEGSELRMAPVTSSDIRLVYFGYPAPLTDANATNWLLAKYPDVYLYGGLLELCIHIPDIDGIARWTPFFEQAINDIGSSAFGANLSPGTSRASTGPAP